MMNHYSDKKRIKIGIVGLLSVFAALLIGTIIYRFLSQAEGGNSIVEVASDGDNQSDTAKEPLAIMGVAPSSKASDKNEEK